MSVPIQRSFQGGEIAPALGARTDQTKYVSGARTIRNLIVRRHGGVTLRPGLQFIAGAKNPAVAVRLLRFVRDSTKVTDTYLLELGDGYIRFYQSGAPIVVAGVAAWVNTTAYKLGDLASQGGINYYCTADHTAALGTNQPGVDTAAATVWAALTGAIYEIPTPYRTADLADLQISQTGDVITIVHGGGGYAVRELKRFAHTKWTLTTVAFGPSIAAPGNFAIGAGGAVGAKRYWAVTATKEGTLEESLPSVASLVDRVPSAGTPTPVSWDPSPGAISYRVFRSTDGVTYGLLGTAGGTPVAKTNTVWTTTTSTASSAAPNAWSAAGTQARITVLIAKADKAYDGRYTIKLRRTLVAGAGGLGAQGQIGMYYSRDGEARVFAGYTATVWMTAPGTQGPTAEAPTILVPDNGYTTLVIDLVPEVYPLSAHTCTMNVDTSTVPNNEVDWSANVLSFSDVGAAPDYAQAPPSQQNLFGAAGSYPSAVAAYQQRQVYANTAADPERVWGSCTGVVKSFSRSTPLSAADSVSFALAGKQVNVVKHLLDLARLLVFTSGSVLVIDGDQSGTLKPDAVNPRKVARQGIGRLAPLEVDDSALYVQARGTIVRDLQPIGAGDQFSGYRGNDLTVFAAHLFDGFTLLDWAYAETPHSIVWAVRSDGTLLGLTYLREQAIWGWHRHDTDGAFENVCVVPEGTEDAVYVVVRRVVNGTTKRSIERMKSLSIPDQPSAFFVDAGLTYTGWHTGTTTMTLSGGALWDATEQLTLTASAASFLVGDPAAGAAIHLLGADGSLVRCTIEAYTSATIVKVRADRLVPAGMRATAIGNGTSFVVGAVGYLGQWAKALKTVTGLDHLEGKRVSVFADGFVVASPNNPAYAVLTVTAGQITLPRPYAMIHAGLPYVGDLVPHEIDAVGATIKDRQQMTPKALLMVQDARGIWVGREDKPTAAKPLNGLQEYKPRKDETTDLPPALHTERIEVPFEGQWDKSGKYGPFLVRQVDPVPLTILAVAPVGYGTQS